MALASLGFVELALLLGLSGAVGLPLGIPPAPEDPALAAAAPEQCVFYMSWAGIAEPDAKSTNQTEQLLAEPEVQKFVAEIEKLIRAGISQSGPRRKPAAAEGDAKTFDLVKVLITHPLAAFASSVKVSAGKPEVQGGVIAALGKEADEFKKNLESVLKDAMEKQDKKLETVQIGGRPWYRIQPDKGIPLFFGFDGAYLIAAVGEGSAETILARMKKEPPAWLTAARKQVRIERPSSLIYLNVKSLLDALLPLAKDPSAKGVVELIGLGNVHAVISATGLEGEGLATRTLIQIDGEARGLLRLVSDRPLRAEDLAPIPQDALLAAALRFNAQEALDTVLASVEKMGPQARQDLTQAIEGIERQLGVDLRHGVLGSLGDLWRVYNSPSEGAFIFTGMTAVVPVTDRSAFSLGYSKLLGMAKQMLPEGEEGGFGFRPRMDHFRFAGYDAYYINLMMIAPAWCLTERELVLSMSPQNLKAYLARRPGTKSLAGVPEVAKLLASAEPPAMIAYSDTPKLFETLYPLVSFYAAPIGMFAGSGGMSFDLSSLPSSPAIARHLRPGTATLTRTKAGIEFRSQGTLPGLGLSVPMNFFFVGLAAGRASSPMVAPERLGDLEERAEKETPSEKAVPARPSKKPVLDEKTEAEEEKSSVPPPPPRAKRAPVK